MKEIKKRKWFILTKHSTRITAICISLLVIGAFSEQVYSKDNLVNKATNITDGIRQEAKRNITGQVKDNMGESLIGVTVQIKGEVGGTITDIDGKFTIKANIGDKLVVSYIGYTPQEIMIDNREHFSIVLNEDVNELQEVVVVGYGTQKRLNVTGSVSSVSSNQLKQSPVANISNALAGRLPGIISVQRGGEPGNDGANIWIRGFGTYGTANSPLIMVDGLERSYDNIDPNEIEDITILKDASSTAVYGVRGANGVILANCHSATYTFT